MHVFTTLVLAFLAVAMAGLGVMSHTSAGCST
jgi:hypothetical protein